MSANPATVTWLTGLALELEWGPSPFAVPPVVILEPDGGVVAIVSEDEAPGVRPGVRTTTYTGFAIEDADRAGALLELTLAALGGDGPLATEPHALPGSLVAALGGRPLRDVGPELRAARAVKDPDEIEALRAAVGIADAGQAAARAALRAGASELELWTETRAAMERRAGARMPVLADLLTGERTAEVSGRPTARTTRERDLLIVDLVPRPGAYWADSCATVALGAPAAPVRAAHEAALGALEAAKAAVRPGVAAGELDRIVRAAPWSRSAAIRTTPGTGWARRRTRCRGSSPARRSRSPRTW